MDGDLLELVEAKMQSSLCLDNMNLQSSRTNFPFTIMSLEGIGYVCNFFEVPVDNDACAGEKPKFGVITDDGLVAVYDTMFRRVTWKQQTNIDKVTWGMMAKWQDETADSTIFLHSRKDGLHLIQQQLTDEVLEANTDPERKLHAPLSYESHIAFCKPIMCSDGVVLLPVGLYKLGILDSKAPERVTEIYTFQFGIMAIKEVGKTETSKFILCTTEDGYVSLLDLKMGLEDEKDGAPMATLLSSMLLPTYPDVESQPIGVCIEGCDKTYVVGTSSKYIFLFKLTEQDSTVKLEPYGKKVLPMEGVSCMTMREGKGVLAAGCFDGTVRLFSFPDMNRISTMSYHSSQISGLMFVNQNKAKTGRWYLLCSAGEPVISVWNIPCNKDS